MHIYYFYKDGYVYVMDDTHKLYRYTNNKNIQRILELENIMTSLQWAIEDNLEVYHDILKEPQEVDRYSFNNITLNTLLLQHHYLGEKAIPVTILEAIVLNILRFRKKENKEKQLLENSIYDENFELLVPELEESLNLLKTIGTYQKEEVSLAELDIEAEKIYIDNTPDLIDEYAHEIAYDIIVNTKPNEIFNQKVEETHASILDTTKENQKRFSACQKINFFYSQNEPTKVKEKLDYYRKQNVCSTMFYTANLMAAIPAIWTLLDIDGSYTNSIHFKSQIALISGYIFLINGLCRKIKKELKNMDNPTLILKKEKK